MYDMTGQEEKDSDVLSMEFDVGHYGVSAA